MPTNERWEVVAQATASAAATDEPADGGDATGQRFFTGADRSEAIEQLLHFARFSEALLLLLGVKGSGRTCLLNQLLRETDPSWQARHIQAARLVATASLADFVLQTFFEREPDGSSIESLVESAELQPPGQPIRLLVIDDAHLLTDQQLAEALLAQNLCNAAGEPLLRCVLAGDTGLEPRIHGLGSRDELVHSIHLPALSLGQVANYIEWRLKDDGRDEKPPFNHGQIDALWRRSRGIPGRIEELLPAFLAEPTAPEGRRDNARPRWPLMHLLGAAALSALLVTTFLYRSGEPDNVPAAGAQIDSLHTGGAAPVEQSAELEAKPAPLAIESKGPVDQPTASANSAQATLPETEAATAEVIPPRAAPSPNLVAVPEPDQGSPVVQNLQEVAAGQVVPEATEPGKPAAPEYAARASEAYLLSLPDSGFVLQVLAAASRASVDRFVARQPNRNDLHVYTSRRKNAPWFGVVVAGFPDLSTARREMQLLPEEQLKQGPWLRSIAEIKAEIGRNRDI